MTDNVCNCGDKSVLVLACSGASDVGEIADRAARKLRSETCAKMSCLSGLGAGLPGYIAAAQDADTLVVIDGCPVECGRRIVHKAGVKNFRHLKLAEQGFMKGKSPATSENVEKACEAAKKLL